MNQPTTSRRTLVVDDQVGLRRLVSRLLTLDGYDVVSAADGPEALALIESNGAPSLAIIDLTMPKMNGITLASKLREQHPSLPIVLMSGFDMDNMLESEVPLKPTAAFLEKPFSREQLVSAVAAAITSVRAQ